MFRVNYSSEKFADATIVRRRPALDFSVTGVVYVAMMLFMGLAAINSQANLLFGVFGLMIGILVVSGVISRLVLRGVVIRRSLPDGARVGQPMSITYEVSNRKRFWPSLSLSISELDGVEAFTTQAQGYMLHVAPRMTASVPALVIPKRRGLHEFDRHQVATSFPFGFVKRALTVRHTDVLLIHPALAKVDAKLLQMCRSADVTGETMRPRPGGADEFYGVKEYRAGDNPRWIYWRRSARSGTLVSKEMTRVSPPRIVLLVDTCLASRSADEHAAVERSVAMAASLAAATLDAGLSVGLCVWSGEWVTISPTRGKRHRDDLLSILARLPLNETHELADLLERCQAVLHTGTTPILFTPRDVQVGVLEGGRGGMLAIPAGSARARGWFMFLPGIDFTTCMPPDQRPKDEPGTRGRGGTKTEVGIISSSASVPASPRPRVPASG